MLIDRDITITTAGSRRAKAWLPSELKWSEMAKKLEAPQRSSETLSMFLKMPKSEQDDLKDVGGYVGGTLNGKRRKAGAVVSRDIITLDLDSIPSGDGDKVVEQVRGLGVAFALYSTRKHTYASPRFRVLIPTDRPVTAEEYEPMARIVCARIGMSYADPTTFEASRLMYWPSVSTDSKYVYEVGDGPLCKADAVLGTLDDWRDVKSWPKVPGETERFLKHVGNQQDPREKEGVVGAFCKAYDVPRALDAFLSDTYTPTDDPGRYTYVKGSTAKGAVLYQDGTFLYSHHGTDPAGGQLLNAYDLVRIHRFSSEDIEASPDTPTYKLPSHQKMAEFARQDPDVRELLHQEMEQRAQELFSDIAPEGESGEVLAVDDGAWLSKLKTRKDGKAESSIMNVFIILQYDPRLKGKLAYDDFVKRSMVMGPLPWNKNEGKRDWTDEDEAALRLYLENVYSISGKDKIHDAFLSAVSLYKFHAVRDYLDGLTWDGTERLDTLLIDYFGAKDDDYTRAVTRKFFVAAVKRIYKPGTKFDTMLILTGAQGCGKSTLLAKMGRGWFTDSLNTFAGKEAAELIQGNWLIEIGELNAMQRSEVNDIKQFLSKRDDVFRAAYGRNTVRHKRQCVFAGTTNETEYLRDQTGNRRFWPVFLHPSKARLSVFDDLDDSKVGQVWAEAKRRMEEGEPLILSGLVEEMARDAQEEQRQVDHREGLIEAFLDKMLPTEWDNWDLTARRMFWQSRSSYTGPLKVRTEVCALEVHCELFNGDPNTRDAGAVRHLGRVIGTLKGWEHDDRQVRGYGLYGRQRLYRRVGSRTDNGIITGIYTSSECLPKAGT